MQRIPEPELMNDPEQAAAYAYADFTEPHENFVQLLSESLNNVDLQGTVLDLGCGPGDITRRVARRFPRVTIDGVDGAQAMLDLGGRMTQEAGLSERIRFLLCLLPDCELSRHYDTVISNSLLHHLNDPLVLWRSIQRFGKPGAAVFAMDLFRPQSEAQARQFVEQYCGEEPDVLKHDFYHSLLAAYTLDEVREQLAMCGLGHLTVKAVSDRHLTVSGLL